MYNRTKGERHKDTAQESVRERAIRKEEKKAKGRYVVPGYVKVTSIEGKRGVEGGETARYP